MGCIAVFPAARSRARRARERAVSFLEMNVEYLVLYYDYVDWRYRRFRDMSSVVKFRKIYLSLFPLRFRFFRVYKLFYCEV